LIELLQDSDPMVAQAAADSLATVAFDPERAVPALVQWWIGHTDVRLRFPLELHRQAQLGPHMGSIARLMTADPETGMRVVDGLARMYVDVDYRPVIPVLKSIAEGDIKPVADEAKRLLGAIEAVRKVKGE
jgi:hypothetical protein